MADDFGPKARDYLGLESLQHYLTISQDEVRIWVWARNAEGAWQEPEIHETGSVPLVIEGQSVSVDLAALYAGIATIQPAS